MDIVFKSAVVVSLFLLSINSRAQSSYYIEDEHTFYGGLVAGTTLSQVDGDNFAGYHKTGFTVGGIAYASLAPKIAGSVEILYTQKGSHASKAQRSNSGTITIRQYDINMSYAEIPVLINYFDRRKSHFGAGISYAQLISGKETATTDPVLSETEDIEKNYPFKKYDLNFVLSGNVHIIKGLFVNIRFQYSLLPVRKKVYPEFGRAEQYNNMWVFRLMYLF